MLEDKNGEDEIERAFDFSMMMMMEEWLIINSKGSIDYDIRKTIYVGKDKSEDVICDFLNEADFLRCHCELGWINGYEKNDSNISFSKKFNFFLDLC